MESTQRGKDSAAYRPDIDGLRAIAVLSVMLFHSGSSWLPGGFLGVDVFFVISGYLITALVATQAAAGTFTYRDFYRRRIARLLPALAITLIAVYGVGFLLYDPHTFDRLGKEMLFSAFGVANLLFAQGMDYFAQDNGTKPLTHLWSLGVEEQFYLVWPTAILLLLAWRRSFLALMALAFCASLIASELAARVDSTAAYFLPQYRVYELLLGALLAIGQRTTPLLTFGTRHAVLQDAVTLVALVLMMTPMFLLTPASVVPGFNALWSCLGAALLIANRNDGVLGKLLSARWLVGIGLISYPLYLYHQPVQSFLHELRPESSALTTFLIVSLVAVPLAWLTYHFIEKPTRRLARSSRPVIRLGVVMTLVSVILATAAVGTLTAMQNGFPWRFAMLNPFAYEVTNQNRRTFDDAFKLGFQVKEGERGKILFVGDSLMQQYALPLSTTLGFLPEEVDVVSRGGCVLLKGVDFRDKFADISCTDLRESLYALKKRYDHVVITQGWQLYTGDLLNGPTLSIIGNETDSDAGTAEGSDAVVANAKQVHEVERWRQFLSDTLAHFEALADEVILIGAHPQVSGTEALRPTLLLREDAYKESLAELRVINSDHLTIGRTFFAEIAGSHTLVSPENIFCQAECQLHDGSWSYFRDASHIGASSTEHVLGRLRSVLQ